MITTEDCENISAAEHAANIVEGRGKSSYIGVTKVISVRIPSFLAAQVQALANKSGKTRNATIATLLEVGLEEVRGRLSPETIEELEAIEQEVLQDEFGHLFAKEA
jgi:predicted DNA-binding protein